jgi:hypothetical protein
MMPPLIDRGLRHPGDERFRVERPGRGHDRLERGQAKLGERVCGDRGLRMLEPTGKPREPAGRRGLGGWRCGHVPQQRLVGRHRLEVAAGGAEEQPRARDRSGHAGCQPVLDLDASAADDASHEKWLVNDAVGLPGFSVGLTHGHHRRGIPPLGQRPRGHVAKRTGKREDRQAHRGQVLVLVWHGIGTLAAPAAFPGG